MNRANFTNWPRGLNTFL